MFLISNSSRLCLQFIIVQLLADLRLRETQVLRNCICTRTRCIIPAEPDSPSSIRHRGCAISTTSTRPATLSSNIQQKSRYGHRNGRSLTRDKQVGGFNSLFLSFVLAYGANRYVFYALFCRYYLSVCFSSLALSTCILTSTFQCYSLR